MIENRGITALLRDRDRHHLVGEAAFSPRRGGALVRADRISVRRLACDAIVARDIFRGLDHARDHRSEEHTSELQSLMRISYAVFCLKKKNNNLKKLLNPKHRVNKKSNTTRDRRQQQ